MPERTTRPDLRRPPAPRAGFTLTELLITIALIVVLLSILLPALGGVWSSGTMAKSMNNMRQIALWMGEYQSQSNDVVLPSRFSYRFQPYKGKVRSNPNPAIGNQYQGTWSDILQSMFDVGVYPDATVVLGNDYRDDSPDRALYEVMSHGDYRPDLCPRPPSDTSAVKNPFRSAAENTKNAFQVAADEGLNPIWVPSNCKELPKPFGAGAAERGFPGFFAANDFFKASWGGITAPALPKYVNGGQLRFPDRSMYLVDSYWGEHIADQAENVDQYDSMDHEVDFRYGGSDGVCLMLFMDGHVDSQTPWIDHDDLAGRGIRVRKLTSRAGD